MSAAYTLTGSNANGCADCLSNEQLLFPLRANTSAGVPFSRAQQDTLLLGGRIRHETGADQAVRPPTAVSRDRSFTGRAPPLPIHPGRPWVTKRSGQAGGGNGVADLPSFAPPPFHRTHQRYDACSCHHPC
jgi:hypothetical protein